MNALVQACIVTLCALFTSFSQMGPDEWVTPDPQRTFAELTARVDDPLSKLASMQTMLAQARQRTPESMREASKDLYTKAHERIDHARTLAERDPQAPSAQQAFRSAWFMTKAAYIQIMVEQSREQERTLQIDLDAVLKRMDAVGDSLDALRPRSFRTASAIASIFEASHATVSVASHEQGSSVSLGDAFFQTGKAALSGPLKEHLVHIARILADEPDISIIVEGHSDSTGDADANVTLSQQRAEAVRSQLISSGIPAARLHARGYGPQRPIADNSTEEGRRLNRRVDLVITE